MANKNREYVYVEGPFGELCRVPADKLAEFNKRKEKIKRGEPVMSEERRKELAAEAMAYLKKLAESE